ncbi:hypothetical protein NDU88_009499 [Pleurodeles waltl]|uniref:Uncharacterized protein n=1 Tax=Pleurodeles waltl TaxID=8319 RepID=A0AAV7QXQ4_PLEWA|nr:hypothetical protein NDU88_009499 [Pleurodeles waltl]
MTCLRHGRKAGGYWAAQNGRSRRSQSCGDRSISALGVARSPSEEISALSTGLPKHQRLLRASLAEPSVLSNVRLSRRFPLRSASHFNVFPQRSSAETDASLRKPPPVIGRLRFHFQLLAESLGFIAKGATRPLSVSFFFFP